MLSIRLGLVSVLFAAMGCTPAIVTPLPPTIRRIAVLPPYFRGAAETATASTGNDLLFPPRMTVSDVLAEQARAQLAEKGFDVIEPSLLKTAMKGRRPTSLQMAAQMIEEAYLDAAAMYIEVRRWEPTPDMRGMKADGVIVALDVMILDPKTGAVLWQVHRPSRPVPLYGVVLRGQAHRFAAETVMREIGALLGQRKLSA
jgi:hypothetical protein